MTKWSIGIGVLVAIMFAPLIAAVTFVAVLAPTPSAACTSSSFGGGWRPPVVSSYRVTARFGQSGGRWSSGSHTGIDLGITGDDRTIVAAAAGTVTTVAAHPAYGNQVVIEHGGGLSTRYGHLAMPAGVTPHQRINAGQPLGVEGATGNVTGRHLHFEVMKDGSAIDPAPFMAEYGAPLDGTAPGGGALPRRERASGVVDATDNSLSAVRSDGTKITLSGEQLENAATITTTGRGLEVPERGLVVALMAGLQESGLRNLDYGDRDSLGLFQQRAGWGSSAERQTPRYAARAFFGGRTGPNRGSPRGLIDIAGWERMGLGEAAQAVQISAYPSLYDRWEPVARAALASVGEVAPASCEAKSEGELRVATWNVCLQFCERLGPWRERLPAIAGQILASDADVVALQETGKSGTHGEALLAAVGSRYRLAAYHRSRMILYDPDRLSVRTRLGRSFPTRMLSLAGRFGVFRVLRVKATGISFVMSSLHPVQGSSDEAETQREHYVRRALGVADDLNAGNARPVVIAGDFNTQARGGSRVFNYLRARGYDTAERETGSREGDEYSSYNGGKKPHRGQRIDHVVVETARTQVISWWQISAADRTDPPTDHNMISIDLAFEA